MRCHRAGWGAGSRVRAGSSHGGRLPLAGALLGQVREQTLAGTGAGGERFPAEQGPARRAGMLLAGMRRDPSKADTASSRGPPRPGGWGRGRGLSTERPVATAPCLRRAPASRARSRTSPGARAAPAPGPPPPEFPRRPGLPSAPRSRRRRRARARAGGRLGRRVSALPPPPSGPAWGPGHGPAVGLGCARLGVSGLTPRVWSPQGRSAACSSVPRTRRGGETSCPLSFTETSR